MYFHTTEQLGPNQALTPEGFLLCTGVPLARTGTMTYGPDEVPIMPGPNGVIEITREESEVFHPNFMASLNGKPVVDDHPSEAVTPSNYRTLAGGVLLNIRRGDGAVADCLVGDLLVCNADEINAVRSGKREVSLGYEADYEELGPGVGRQLNMVGNHVALVHAGRCGARCAIGDKSRQEQMTMVTKDKAMTWLDRIKAALRTKDEAAVARALDEASEELKEKTDDAEGEGDETHVHVHTGDAALATRVAAVEDRLGVILDRLSTLDARLATRDNEPDDDEKEKKKKAAAAAADSEAEKELEEEAGTKDARMAKDSALLSDSFQETLASAEILVPGIRIPTFDRASNPKQTLDTICKLRKQALDLAYHSPDGRALIEDIHGRPLVLDGMTCGAARTLFRAAVAAKRITNNSAATHDTSRTQAGTPVIGTVRSIAELNKLNAERYSGK